MQFDGRNSEADVSTTVEMPAESYSKGGATLLWHFAPTGRTTAHIGKASTSRVE